MEDMVSLDATFWKGKRVFVTGHTGFKGGWLCLWLRSLGAQVTGYALDAPTRPSLFDVALVGEAVESVIGDIRDRTRLAAALRHARPEIVFHLAAQPLVRASYRDPFETYSVNVMGTVTLLEAIRELDGVRVVINVTSDKCYENREWIWGYRENEPMGGYDPYSSSKGCAELVTAAYRNSFFNIEGRASTVLASARAGNVIGGGDWAEDRLIPDVVRAFSRNEPAVIRRPDAVRPWQHVLEPLSGYMLLAERIRADGIALGEGWNFGPEPADAWPVAQVVERLGAHWGSGATWRLDDGPHPHEASYLKLDCSKAMTRLKWRPRWNLDTALDKTAEWYKAHLAHRDVRELTLRQIAEYTAGSGNAN